MSWLLAGFLALIAIPVAHADAASCNGKQATIVSNAAKIVGTKAPDVIVAGPGDNTIYGEGGNDTICGGEGNDTIYGGRGNDALFGEGGNDTLHGERGSDDLDGGAGRRPAARRDRQRRDSTAAPATTTRSSAAPATTRSSGGDGDFDVLTGGPGNDAIDGGPGAHDIASYAGTGGAVTIDLEAGTVSGAEGEQLNGIEDAIGGSGDDTLIGATGQRQPARRRPRRRPPASPPAPATKPSAARAATTAAAASAPKPPAARGRRSGTAVELYDSIDDATSLIVTGNDGADDVTVSYAGGPTSSRAPGRQPDPARRSGSAAARDPARLGLLPGPISAIQASLGGGNDSFAVDASVPASVSAIIDGGKGSDTLRGGQGDDTLYAGDDHDPDTLEGGGGDDVLYGVNIFHPRKDSGAATMLGGPGDDLLIGGQPCDGDLFDGGPGDNDSASFARVRNGGIFVEATIGGAVTDPDVRRLQRRPHRRQRREDRGLARPRHPHRRRRRQHAARPRRRRPARRQGRLRRLRRRRRQQPSDQLRVHRFRPPLRAQAQAPRASPARGVAPRRRVAIDGPSSERLAFAEAR